MAKTAEEAMGNLVKLAINEAFAAGKRAHKMEHQRNEARHKRTMTKRLLRDRIKQLEGTLKAASDEVVKLTVERDALVTERDTLRGNLAAFQADPEDAKKYIAARGHLGTRAPELLKAPA